MNEMFQAAHGEEDPAEEDQARHVHAERVAEFVRNAGVASRVDLLVVPREKRGPGDRHHGPVQHASEQSGRRAQPRVRPHGGPTGPRDDDGGGNGHEGAQDAPENSGKAGRGGIGGLFRNRHLV